MWKWNATMGFFDTVNTIDLAYLDISDGASQFVVGIDTANLGQWRALIL